MAEATIQLGGGNWAGKTDNLLGYYKEGERFYKQDFTFSRSTTGTYTDSDGYIQEMPYNKLLQSETFENASWSKTGVTVTANSVISPNGQTKADTLVFGASGNEIVQSVGGLIVGDDYTFSIYLRVDSGTTSVTIGNISYVNTSITITSEWQRFEITQAAAATTRYPKIVSSEGVTIYAWGAQLVKGTSAKTYFPTTTRLNMPRVDYLNNSNGSLILEPQRTNVFTESNDYTGWNGYQVTSNTTTAPDGSSVLFLDFEDVRMYPTTTISSATEYTSSIYLKANKVADVKLRNARNEDTIISLTTDWVRYELTATSNATSTNALLIDARFSQGLGASGLEIALFGGQIEAGSYPTSLINTTGTAVTRLADASATTGLSDVIGQTEGTIYVEFECLTILGNQMILDVSDNSSSDRVGLQITSSKITAFRISPLDTTSIINSSVINENTLYRCAFAYKNGRHAFYLNGSKVGEDTNTITSISLNKVDVGQRFNGGEKLSGKVKNLQIFKTALTDTELETLTTL